MITKIFVIITDTYFADDISLISSSLCDAQNLLSSLEGAATVLAYTLMNQKLNKLFLSPHPLSPTLT